MESLNVVARSETGLAFAYDFAHAAQANYLVSIALKVVVKGELFAGRNVLQGKKPYG